MTRFKGNLQNAALATGRATTKFAFSTSASALIVGMAAICASPSVAAEGPNDQASDIQVGDIVVTAQKREERLDKVPMVISV